MTRDDVAVINNGSRFSVCLFASRLCLSLYLYRVSGSWLCRCYIYSHRISGVFLVNDGRRFKLIAGWVYLYISILHLIFACLLLYISPASSWCVYSIRHRCHRRHNPAYTTIYHYIYFHCFILAHGNEQMVLARIRRIYVLGSLANKLFSCNLQLLFILEDTSRACRWNSLFFLLHSRHFLWIDKLVLVNFNWPFSWDR